MRKLAIFCALFLALPGAAVLAADFAGGQTYTLPASQTTGGNLYAGGGTVSILGTASQDLLLAGGNVNVSGATGADLLALGGSLNINGPVADDARLAGGNISINAPIGGELAVAGGNILVGKDTTVAEGAYLAGGQATIDGTVGGASRIFAGLVTINGTVNGDLTVRAGQKLVIGSGAVINGKLIYQAPAEAEIASDAKIVGETVFTKLAAPTAGQKTSFWGFFALGWLIKVISFGLAALILFWIFARRSRSLADMTANHFWREVLRGLIILVVSPIVILLAFVSVVGWVIGLIGLFVYLALLFLAAVVSVLATAGLLEKYLFRRTALEIRWYIIILGVVVLGLVGLIPIVGWLVVLAIFLASLGTICKMRYDEVRE